MKKILFILSLVLFISCDDSKKEQNEIPPTPEVRAQSDVVYFSPSNAQYEIKFVKGWNPVDVRIITLSKDSISHDYVIATGYIGRGGGVSLEHWAGCKCLKNN